MCLLAGCFANSRLNRPVGWLVGWLAGASIPNVFRFPLALPAFTVALCPLNIRTKQMSCYMKRKDETKTTTTNIQSAVQYKNRLLLLFFSFFPFLLVQIHEHVWAYMYPPTPTNTWENDCICLWVSFYASLSSELTLWVTVCMPCCHKGNRSGT